MSGKTKAQKLSFYQNRPDCYFIGDKKRRIYHQKDCILLNEVVKNDLVACGWNPENQGFRPCQECRPQPAERPPKAAEPQPTKAELMRRALVSLAERHEMSIRFVGNTAFVTTVAGEWYFDYGNSPIILHHKNAEKRFDGQGRLTGYFHRQEGEFSSPMEALAYISRHEKATERRLFQSGTVPEDRDLQETVESKIYDDASFFKEYAEMPRSIGGLTAAGEWHQFRPLFPPMQGKRVLDLGCGYGWHCKFAEEQGAEQVLGIDASARMIEEANRRNPGERIQYRVCDINDYEYPEDAWDCVVSNLVLHYIRDLDWVYRRVHDTLKPGGIFMMNIEHPVFTAGVRQEWIVDEDGNPMYWPVDDYFMPGPRMTTFCGCRVKKEHHTLTQILMGLIDCGFTLEAVEEARPSADMMSIPGMKDELRRPMMLLVKARAQK